MTTDTLTSANNNWTCPAWVRTIQIEAWGAGGGGAGANNNTTGAAGGGGGAYARSNVAVIPGTVYTVSIPVGGAGGGNNANGTAGGNTNFNNNQIKAVGGGGGLRGAGNGGAGGLNNACVGDVAYSGGAGYTVAANTKPGGGGGAAGGNAAAGNNSVGQAGATGAGSGGSGGNGGNNNTVGNNGVLPGGGGGGGGNRTSGTKTGGTGGAGQIIVTYTAAVPIVLSASGNIAANAATATTALMTAPANKTSGNNFQAGLISDDTNPLTAIDLAADKYTELEWSIKAVGGIAANGDVYLLRVSANGTPLTTYTVTPQWTIGSVFSGKVSTCYFG